MLYGKGRLTLATLAIAVLVPLVNFLSVIVLIKIPPLVSERSFWSALVWHLITNPLIIASGLGIFLNAVSWQLPISIDTTISALGQATLPLGLLAVGAGMNGQTIRTATIPRAWSNAFKLIEMPAAMILSCKVLGVTGLPTHIAILFASLPSASTAYILARQMGGDARSLQG